MPANHAGMTTPHQSQLVNLRELARRLRRFGITHAWLKQEAEAGRIPCMRAGRRLLFNVEAVEESLIERATNGEGGGHA